MSVRTMRWARRAIGATLCCALTTMALAEGGRYTVTNDKWMSECGACHLAYPPQLLSADSWRGVIKALDRHFGVDASVDGATARELQAFAESNSATGKRATGPATLRISESRWFERKHDELPSGVWKRPAVKSAANCAACHPQAERGVYDERGVRVPR